MTNIAVVGTGALGTRHLQALGRLNGPLLVELVDPYQAARDKAMSVLAETGGLNGEVRQVSRIEELTSTPDLAIVATNARDRLAAIQYLCKRGCPSLILEKILFTRHEEYALAEAAIRSAGAKVWVNCVRRTAPRFHRLQELIAGRAFSYHVEGDDWNLACNVIHHLDEWVLLSGVKDVKLSGSFNPEMIPARRSGYFEVFGCLRGTAGAHTFEAVSTGNQGSRPAGDRTITIGCEDVKIVIGQSSQEIVIQRGTEVVAREAYPLAMQSEATAWHVATILVGGEPALPRYAESAKLHLALLDVLIPHFQSLDPNLKECPIT